MDDANDNAGADGKRANGTEPDWDAVVFQETKVEETLAAKSEILNRNLGRTGAADELVATLRQHFPPPEHSLQNISEAVRDTLVNYFGEDTAALIFWLAKDDGSFADRIEVASKYLSAESVGALRLLFGTYGRDLQLCFRLLGNLLHDWRTVNWQLWYNQGDGRHEIRITLLKENNDLIRLECPPPSVLTLARVLVSSVRAVPNVREYLDEAAVAKFQSSVDDFYESFAKKAEEPEGEASDLSP